MATQYVTTVHRLLNVVDFDLHKRHPEIIEDMQVIAEFCAAALERIEAKTGCLISESAEADGVVCCD